MAEPKKSHKSNLSGLGFLNSTSVQDKAHLPSPVSKAHKVDSYTGDLGVSIHRDQCVYVVGESSRPAMESSVVSVSPEGSNGRRTAFSHPRSSYAAYRSHPGGFVPSVGR